MAIWDKISKSNKDSILNSIKNWGLKIKVQRRREKIKKFLDDNRSEK